MACSVMVAAARTALAAAAVAPSSVDLLLGHASVSEYITPNSLAQVHAEIGLPASTAVLPLADDFTNVNSGVMLADALIQQGRCRRALIVCGANWTRYVNDDPRHAARLRQHRIGRHPGQPGDLRVRDRH
ncbi:MAG: hypothetical protein ACRDRW_07035 [Pseudonocardiaceae bacterium]